MNPYSKLIDDGFGRKVKGQNHFIWQEGWDAKEKEEYEFLDRILHESFFEFCLLVKERKQAIAHYEEGSNV